MIKIGNVKVEVNHFPDGTQRLTDIGFYKYNIYAESISNGITIHWTYEGDEECMTLYFLVKHLRNVYKGMKIYLVMLYCPNCRMDRVKTDCEVFTLKWFCEFINDLNFDKVTVLDPHSDVTPALLNNVCVLKPEAILNRVDEIITKEVPQGLRPCLFFPDAGAKKRYSYSYIISDNMEVYYGAKDRDWSTGKIRGLKIFDREDKRVDGSFATDIFKNKLVLMIDDIISYGGTLYYSALKLKELGADYIYAYASHTENSVLDREKGTFIKCLEDGTVKKLFTSSSLFTKDHPNIVVI